MSAAISILTPVLATVALIAFWVGLCKGIDWLGDRFYRKDREIIHRVHRSIDPDKGRE
jgi:hypothetical protein